MKQVPLICALALTALLLCGCARQQEQTPSIGEEEARAKALTHAGLTDGQVTFESAKLDYEDGRQVYELKFRTGKGQEYEYEIDAATGAVVRYDYDAGQRLPSSPDGSLIPEEQARELALSRVPGAAAGDILEFKTDLDDGRTEYEGKIVYGGMMYEFEIDGYSGELLKWEAEPYGG